MNLTTLDTGIGHIGIRTQSSTLSSSCSACRIDRPLDDVICNKPPSPVLTRASVNDYLDGAVHAHKIQVPLGSRTNQFCLFINTRGAPDMDQLRQWKARSIL